MGAGEHPGGARRSPPGSIDTDESPLMFLTCAVAIEASFEASAHSWAVRQREI